MFTICWWRESENYWELILIQNISSISEPLIKCISMLNTDMLVKITCYAVLSEILFMSFSKLFKKFRRQRTNTLTHSLKEQYDGGNSTDEFHKVLFFPDSGIVCRRVLSGRICRDRNCVAVHDKTSLSVLINLLNLSQKSVDVCVYMITCSLLGDTLVECQKRGVKVRVITEERNSGEEGEICGAQIGKLRASGVIVRCRSSSFWMHHKFLVADNEILVNGSFNWTNQAVMGNLENLIITSESALVNPFILEFQKIWDDLGQTEISLNCQEPVPS